MSGDLLKGDTAEENGTAKGQVVHQREIRSLNRLAHTFAAPRTTHLSRCKDTGKKENSYKCFGSLNQPEAERKLQKV